MRVWSLKMAIFASFVHCLPNILQYVYMPTRQFSRDATVDDLGRRYFKVVRLFHIKFLKNGV